MATDLYTVTLKAESKGVNKTTQEMNKLGTSAGLATKAFKAFVPLIAAAFSARALAGLASQANQFSAAMAEVNTLLSGNSEMPRLTQEAKNLAAQFGGSPTQQAQAFYQAISAGAGNAEQATALLTAANKLAIGGVTDVTTAVDGLTSITNAYGIETSEASRVSDALFVAMRAGKTTVGELSGSIGKVAATAATAGLSFEETLGSISALTTQGIATAEAVTGLKATLSNILKPSKAASDAAEELGIDFSLAGLQSKGLAGFLDELVTATGGSEAKLLDLFGSTEALNTVFALTGGAAETFSGIMVDMTNSAGQTDTAFNKVSNTMSQKLDVLKGKFAVTGVELGNFIVTASTPFVDVLNANYDDYIQYFKNLFTATKTTLNALIQLWAPWATQVSKIVSNLFEFIAKLFSPLIKVATSMLKVFLNLFYGTFKFITTGAETAVRNIVDTFRKGFTIFIPRFIETTKIQIVAFYETMAVKAKSFYQTELNTEKQLAEINTRKANSLAAVTQKYADQQKASFNLADQTNITTGFFNTLEASVDIVKTTFGEMNTATTTLDDSAIDLDSSLAGINTQTQALETNNINAVVALDNSTAATKRNKDAQEIHKNMIENVQKSFGDLIYKTLDDGKLNFKSFFSSVLDGFKRMIAELAAQKIMNAIFGNGGLNGFLSSLSGGFSSIFATIGSSIASMASKAASGIASIVGGGAGGAASGAAGSAAGSAGIGAAITGAAGAAGQFIAGVTGTATGIAAGTVGPPTAAALAGSGVTSTLAAGGAKLVALATNPVTLTIAAIAVAAKLLDKSGTMSANAGLITDPSINLGDRGFTVPEFASGAQFQGFNRREDQATANSVVEAFATLDATLTAAAKSVGITPNLNAASFVGSSETGRGVGAFLGTASEDGKTKSASLQDQLDSYATQWVTLVGNQSGVDPSVIANVIGEGTVEGILSRTNPSPSVSLNGNMGGFVGPVPKHQSGLNSVPYDGYIAELHAGERVQTRAQVAATDRMSSEMVGLRNNLNELMLVVAKAVAKTARIEDRWDKNGLPPVRA